MTYTYTVYDPATGKDVELVKDHEITAHTAAKYPGFSGDVPLSVDSDITVRIERGEIVHLWNGVENRPLAIYEPCCYGGLDRVYRIKLTTFLRSSRYVIRG